MAAASFAMLYLLLSRSAMAQTDLLLVDQNNVPVQGVIVWSDVPPQGTVNRDTPTGTPRAEVDQRDKRFTPYVSVVAPGTDVFFPNSDDIRHHVYSFSEGNTFERKLYRANEAEPVRFATPGVVALGCNIHDNMQAYVLVEDEPVLISDPDGMAALPEGARELRLWHPLLGEEKLSASLADMDRNTRGQAVLILPFEWQDPQAPRSANQLESLLKQFSRDAR
jgi:plastocyanin